jgi:hemolysin activation/secretion protein
LYTKCITGKLIKNILDTINNNYSKNGYITSKAFLKPQNIQDGQIDINILVGKIDKIIDNDTNTTTPSIATAFIGQAGETLNLRDMETALEMINRVPSVDANFKIIPAKKQSRSKVLIEKKETTPIHFSIGATGSKTLNDSNPSLVARVSLDNPFGINDIFTYTLNGSRIQKEYQSNKAREFNYSFIIGSYLLELIHSNSTYKQGVDGINARYLSRGRTKGNRFKISKIISRDQSNKYKVAFSIFHKDAKSYLEDELIEVSSYKTTHIQADFLHTFIQKWGTLNTTFSIYQGKDWFGARDDEYYLKSSKEVDYSTLATLEFTKYSLNTNAIIYLPNREYKIDSNFYWQYSDDELYDSDKLSVGSDYSVRGYSGDYYGNKAAYIKNDFIKETAFQFYEPLLQNISVYLGIDYGYVPCEKTNNENCGTLYGMGTGLRTNGKNFSTDFSWNRPLKKLKDDFILDNNFKYNFTMKF